MATTPKSFNELYDEFYKAITENPDTPQIMHDEELARKFAERLKTMNPKAFIICVKGGLQYLTITDEARLVVAELLNADAMHAAEKANMLGKYAAMVTPEVDKTFFQYMADHKEHLNKMLFGYLLFALKDWEIYGNPYKKPFSKEIKDAAGILLNNVSDMWKYMAKLSPDDAYNLYLTN